MKVTKIPGLGRFGVFIDEVNFDHITDDEWMEIGKIHLESLVTIIKTKPLDYKQYYSLACKFGTPRLNIAIKFYKKYNKPFKDLTWGELDDEDKNVIRSGRRWQLIKSCPALGRVSPRTNSRGQSIGIFGDGELYWHSNEAGDPAFTPGVALMGVESMVGSCTGFCTTVDWYEEQSDSFKSELDEMIVVYEYREGAIEKENFNTNHEYYRNNACPEENNEVPLIMKSPSGIKGVHIFPTIASHIRGMSKEESKKIFDTVTSGIIQEKYIYKHWYHHDGDILLFDNSITLHNREIKDGTSPNRLAYRIQFDYDNLTGHSYVPYFQDEFNNLRESRLKLRELAMS